MELEAIRILIDDCEKLINEDAGEWKQVPYMKKNSFGQGLAVFLVVIGIFYIIGAISEASEPKCIKSGCDNKQATNSSYCYLHKPYTGSSSSHSSSSYSNKSTSSSSSSSYNNKSTARSNTSSYNSSAKKRSTGTSSSKKSNTYDSYDDGYDDIYMDGDYDYDRYDRDSDYADGVDDAMDEFDEDW